MATLEDMTDFFICESVGGWVALRAKSIQLTGFRTSRLAKLVDGYELQFNWRNRSWDAE
jgi:hypothetical protein